MPSYLPELFILPLIIFLNTKILKLAKDFFKISFLQLGTIKIVEIY